MPLCPSSANLRGRPYTTFTKCAWQESNRLPFGSEQCGVAPTLCFMLVTAPMRSMSQSCVVLRKTISGSLRVMRNVAVCDGPWNLVNRQVPSLAGLSALPRTIQHA